MRKTSFFFLAMIVITSHGCSAGGRRADDAADAGWHLLHRGTLSSVEAEMALYERRDEPHFFIRVRVRNLSDRPIAVDLRDRRRVIHPNQWGPLDSERRGAIDERRLEHEALAPSQREELIAAFGAGKLTAIPVGGTVDYFREFNANARADVDQQAAGYRFVFVSLDGQQIVTDGEAVEQFACEWKHATMNRDTDLILPAPVLWKTVPTRSVIVSERALPPTRPEGR